MLSASVFLGLGLGMIVVDALSYRSGDEVVQFSLLTRVPGVALSVSYLEPRIRAYRDFSTTLFPGMPPIDQMDFVYAR